MAAKTVLVLHIPHISGHSAAHHPPDRPLTSFSGTCNVTSISETNFHGFYFGKPSTWVTAAQRTERDANVTNESLLNFFKGIISPGNKKVPCPRQQKSLPVSCLINCISSINHLSTTRLRLSGGRTKPLCWDPVENCS